MEEFGYPKPAGPKPVGGAPEERLERAIPVSAQPVTETIIDEADVLVVAPFAHLSPPAAQPAVMTRTSLYPLRFDPIYQYRLWGGRRLGEWLGTPLPGDGPIGEAWMLSDRDDHPSRVADGPLKGQTIAQVMELSPTSLLGQLAARFQRFPLLLKFLDVHEMLSVQVHPGDDKTDLIPKGQTGKTEAWVVLEAEPGSCVYAGLQPKTTAADLRTLSTLTVEDHLASFAPVREQAILIEAGVVHALGDGVVVMEVQQNSDITFRLFDWDHIDTKTGHPRELQVEQALACVDFRQGAIEPVAPIAEVMQSARRERLVDCSHFRLWRLRGATPFPVGVENAPRVLVCVDGGGDIEHDSTDFRMEKGTVMLLPAAIGTCRFRPDGAVTLLEIAVPDQS
jgi:mannose-6-phosphate isomerase